MTVLLTATARGQLEALERHYATVGRDLATIRMTEAVAMAAARIEERAGPFLPFPRPYPDLAELGWLWLKEGRYWIGFTPKTDAHALTAVFYDTADIPSRI